MYRYMKFVVPIHVRTLDCSNLDKNVPVLDDNVPIHEVQQIDVPVLKKCVPIHEGQNFLESWFGALFGYGNLSGLQNTFPFSFATTSPPKHTPLRRFPMAKHGINDLG